MATLVLHALAPSHPVAAVVAALELKGLDYERVELPLDGTHPETIEQLYGPGNRTVPGLLIDDEPVHGSTAIMWRLEQLAPDAHKLYPEPIARQVREAELWADRELQPLGRGLPWGALHFRPEQLGLLAGAGPLDPAGTDFAIRMIRAAWRHHVIDCTRIAAELAALPGLLGQIDELIADGICGSGHVNAADLQIGATLAVLLAVGDVRGWIEPRPCARLAQLLPPRPGTIPAGALPANWMPAAN